MRVLHVAFAISVVVHGAAIAWVQLREPEPEPAQPVTPASAQASEPPPTEVTLLDDYTVVAAAPVPSPPSHTPTKPAPGKSRISTGATTPKASETSSETSSNETAATPSAPEEPAKPGSTLMTMRHPKIEKGPSAAFWSKFAANTKPVQPKDIASERLADDIAGSEDRLGNPKWIANASPNQIAAERVRLAAKRMARSQAELKADGAGTKSEHRTFNAKFNADGTVAKLEDGPGIKREGAGASFDVTDSLMRRKGIDPYSSAKLKVLDDTREERVAIGKRHRTQQLAQSRKLAQKNIERLWATITDLDARKRALFELWDDCAETGSAELVAGGAAARAHVLGFIRSKLPAGSGDAYTADELARFNKQRKSRASFAPYEAM